MDVIWGELSRRLTRLLVRTESLCAEGSFFFLSPSQPSSLYTSKISFMPNPFYSNSLFARSPFFLFFFFTLVSLNDFSQNEPSEKEKERNTEWTERERVREIMM